MIGMDWLPTLIAAAGTMLDPAYPSDGMDLLPRLTQGAAPVPRSKRRPISRRTTAWSGLVRSPSGLFRSRLKGRLRRVDNGEIDIVDTSPFNLIFSADHSPASQLFRQGRLVPSGPRSHRRKRVGARSDAVQTRDTCPAAAMRAAARECARSPGGARSDPIPRTRKSTASS